MVVQHTYGLTVVISAGPGMYPVKRYGDDLGREKTKIIAARFHKFYIFSGLRYLEMTSFFGRDGLKHVKAPTRWFP